ncbi:kinase-like domain-containing protein [Glomus cerebriforme]|uniref:Kinase-like domain-containing protein n=1 Tax=Glomus cerebriforme TaxID=658196 RepID=A0A397TNM9_9GLOM|nr:kinase-like domain-containing protein [Glomus cerebriforme]
MPYIDPKIFSTEDYEYELNKKSDVYSIGVLMWQISSGRQPFYCIDYDIRLSMAITNGEREEIIKDTPIEYINLYTECWKYEPNERPNIEQVVSTLDRLSKIDFKSFHDYQKEILIRINKIDSKDLANPTIERPDDRRGKFIIRKIYKGQEVACKPILKKTTEEMKTCSKTLKFLTEISECKQVLRFYGISTIKNNNVMVLEWAERGTLKQLYEQKHIPWKFKARIALEISRGLVFLQDAGIVHNDLKCQNILITESLEPKIYNFKLACYSDENITSSPVDLAAGNILRWIAPEKLTDSQYITKFETFSFGMLFWELTFEKIPYKGWKVEKIRDHVIKGDREKILFGALTPEIYQEGFKKIIKETWKHNPKERITFMKLLDMLEELYYSIRMSDNNSSNILPDKNLDDDLELPDEDNSPVITII